MPRNVKLTASVAHLTKIGCLSTFSLKSTRKQHVCCALKVLPCWESTTLAAIMRQNTTRHKLLQVKDRTLAKAIDVCKASKAAGKQLKAMTNAKEEVQALHGSTKHRRRCMQNGGLPSHLKCQLQTPQLQPASDHSKVRKIVKDSRKRLGLVCFA